MPTGRMHPADAAWLRMDEPTNPMVVTALLRLPLAPDPQALRDRLHERVLAPFPRFRQRPVPGAAGPSWVDCPDFDLDAHLVMQDLGGGEAALADEVGRRLGEGLPGDRPLWRAWLLRGEAGAALLVRIHHALGDGFALARVLLSLADEGEPLARPVEPRPTGPSLVQAGLDLLHHRPHLRDLAHHAHEGERALRHLALATPDPPSPLRRPLGTTKRAAWCTLGPVAALREAAHRHGVSINDLYVAALAGALREVTGPSADRPLRAFVPVNLRPLDQPVPAALGNRFGLVYLPLPVHQADPLERLATVHGEVIRLKRSPEAVLAFGILELMGALPDAAEALLVSLFAAKGSAVVTNVPGPTERLHLLGLPIEDVMFWVPQAGRVAVGTSLFSYAGELRLGVATDAGVLPDPAALAREVAAQLAAYAGG